MIINDAPRALFNNTAVPMREVNICNEIVAPTPRLISISLENDVNEMTGLMVEAVLGLPLMISLVPMSKEAVVFTW